MMNNHNGIVSAFVEIEIPFFDVDSLEITWHGNYIKYFEIARCSLLEKINYDYKEMKDSGFAWPIVDVRVKYIKPSRFKQKVIVEAILVEYENRLKIHYLIKDKETDEKITKGYSIQVAIDMNTNEMCFVSPGILKKRLEKYL